ncbi:MAG: MBL fold metallo-hydrolase [Bdellovibrionales bacterium]|nr:MBL fold metallo-hydrolase [Bdellovibrionales bacterium]
MEEKPHFDGRKFFNPGKDLNKNIWQLLKWQLFNKKTPWPKWRENKIRVKLPKKIHKDEFYTTYINHATHLIQFNKQNLITDPVFSERVSPVTWAGPKRHRPPALAISQLPPIHIALISHNHYDHMDKTTIFMLAQKFETTFIVPLGNKKLLESFGAKKIIELDWWQETKVGDLSITLTEVQHWSARTLMDRNKSLWGGFIIRSPTHQIFFSGDTGYGPFFSKIKTHFGPMDLSILPIGAYEPRWFMKEQHMNPDEAVKAHFALSSKTSLATHFGTFQLTNEGIDEPIEALKKACKERFVAEKDFIIPDIGETHRFQKTNPEHEFKDF